MVNAVEYYRDPTVRDRWAEFCDGTGLDHDRCTTAYRVDDARASIPANAWLAAEPSTLPAFPVARASWPVRILISSCQTVSRRLHAWSRDPEGIRGVWHGFSSGEFRR